MSATVVRSVRKAECTLCGTEVLALFRYPTIVKAFKCANKTCTGVMAVDPDSIQKFEAIAAADRKRRAARKFKPDLTIKVPA